MKKETLAQVFSCKIWGIFKKIFFTENHQTTASENSWTKNVVKQY